MITFSRKTSVAVIVIIAVVVVTTLLVSTFGALNYLSTRQREFGKFRHDVTLDAEQMTPSLALPVWNFDRPQLDKIVESMMRDGILYGVVVKAPDGKTVLCARERDARWNIRAVEKENPPAGLLQETRTIVFGREILGTVQLFATPRYVEARLRRILLWTIAEILALDLILILSLFLLLHRWIFRPLQQVRAYAAAVSTGGRVAPIPAFQGELEDFCTSMQQMIGQLQHAQRLESLGMLAAGIAHDFNNNLSPIVMAAPLLRLQVKDPGGLALLNTVQKSADRSVALVRQLLAFASGTHGETHLLQLRYVLRELCETAEATFPKSIRIEADLPDNLWPVQANATQLHRVFLNLCVNARDAMPAGGTLAITAANCRLGPAEAAGIAEGRPGSFVAVEVRDTGTGIAPEVLTRIWEPFYTTKSEGKGTGLGLSTVHGIVQSYDGFLTVQSQVGRGSVFTVYLPAAESISGLPGTVRPTLTDPPAAGPAGGHGSPPSPAPRD